MPHYTTDALILRTYKLGESDRLVVFLTRDRGKKRGVAKNARQSRRRFGGALESMTWGRVEYMERERRDLVSVRYVEVARSPLSAADPEALGIGLQALIFVQLTRHSREMVESFRQHALSVPQVVALYHVAGADDFLVHVVAHDSHGLRDLAMTAFTTRPEVARIETHLIFEHRRSPELPRLVEAEEWG